MIYIFAVLIGIVAGLRAMTPLAAISWAAYLGWIDYSGTQASFIGNIVTVLILTLAALAELVTDQLPHPQPQGADAIWRPHRSWRHRWRAAAG